MDLGSLDFAVNTLLLSGQAVEIKLRRGRERFDNVFQRVFIDPVHEVEQHDRGLGIGQKLRKEVALGEVLAHRMVVGEIAIVHQGFVHADEWMAAARVPHAPPGGIALVGDPHVRA